MATDIEEERKAWARLVLAERALRAQEAKSEEGWEAHAAREEVDCAEDDLRRLVPHVDDYFAETPEQCGQCGAEIQGHHGYCEIVTDDDPPPSGE